MEPFTGNSTLTFVNEEFLTLAPGLITVPGLIAVFTIYVTMKIFLKNRHKLETIHLFIINGLLGKAKIEQTRLRSLMSSLSCLSL